MTSPAPSAPLRRMLRMILMATSALLALGLTMSLLVTGPAAEAATALIWVGLGLLVLVPVLNVVGVLIDEWHAADRRFAAAAVAVLALLAYTIAAALSKNH
jgi:uncharacterized membrane protein